MGGSEPHTSVRYLPYLEYGGGAADTDSCCIITNMESAVQFADSSTSHVRKLSSQSLSALFKLIPSQLGVGPRPGNLGSHSHTVTLQSTFLCPGPWFSSVEWVQTGCCEVWEGAVEVTWTLLWHCRRRPQTVRRRSTGSPSCPSPPAQAPSSAGSARRTLRPLRGKQLGRGPWRPGGWCYYFLKQPSTRIPDARVGAGLAPLLLPLNDWSSGNPGPRSHRHD